MGGVIGQVTAPELLLGPLCRDPDSGLAWPTLWLGRFSGPKPREAVIQAEGRSALLGLGLGSPLALQPWLQTHESGRGFSCGLGPQF